MDVILDSKLEDRRHGGLRFLSGSAAAHTYTPWVRCGERKISRLKSKISGGRLSLGLGFASGVP